MRGPTKSKGVNRLSQKTKNRKQKIKESLKIAEEYKNRLLKATLGENTLTDTTCTVCYKECYDIRTLERHNEFYSWQCLLCGKCLKFREDESCNESCTGAANKVTK